MEKRNNEKYVIKDRSVLRNILLNLPDNGVMVLTCFKDTLEDIPSYITVYYSIWNKKNNIDDFFADIDNYYRNYHKDIPIKETEYYILYNDIFKDAKYGTLYKCRDYSKPAIFLGKTKDNTSYCLLIPDRLENSKQLFYDAEEYGCDKITVEDFEQNGMSTIGNYFGGIDIIGKYID